MGSISFLLPNPLPAPVAAMLPSACFAGSGPALDRFLCQQTIQKPSGILIEGVLDIVLYFKIRSARGSAWLLFDGVVTLLLSLLIWIHWPSSSAWAIGTLVGVSLIMSGVARVMMSLALRRLTPPATMPRAA